MKKLIALTLTALALVSLCVYSQSNPPGSVTMAWTAGINSDYPLSAIAGYNLWYGTNANTNAFTSVLFITNPMTLSVTGKVTNLPRGTLFYFAVKEIGTNALASEFSNEISAAPFTPPPIPTTLTVIKIE